MQRREFITSATATTAAASIAGCSGILGGDGDGDDSGPEEVVRAYINAGADGDQEAIEETVHPDAPGAMAQAANLFSMADSIDIQSTEVVEQSDEEATVDVTYEVDNGGGMQTTTTRYILRTNEDGEWKIYSGT